jgi:hypothetical protein
MATYTVNVNGVDVKTTVTNSASCVDSFITELILSCDYSASRPPPIIIGLDVEFKDLDDFPTNHKAAATLQLCSSSRCIIIQLINMEAIPESLANFLSAPLFCFAGVGIEESLRVLRRGYGLECRHVVDLKPLLDLAVFMGDVELEPKPLSVVMGDWGARNLSMDQIETAAADAYTFFEIGSFLFG